MPQSNQGFISLDIDEEINELLIVFGKRKFTRQRFLANEVRRPSDQGSSIVLSLTPPEKFQRKRTGLPRLRVDPSVSPFIADEHLDGWPEVPENEYDKTLLQLMDATPFWDLAPN